MALFNLFEIMVDLSLHKSILSFCHWLDLSDFRLSSVLACKIVRGHPYYHEVPRFFESVTFRAKKAKVVTPCVPGHVKSLRNFLRFCNFKRINLERHASLTDEDIEYCGVTPTFTHVSLKLCYKIKNFAPWGGNELVQIDLRSTQVTSADLVHFRRATNVCLAFCQGIRSVRLLESVETLNLTSCDNIEPGAFDGIANISVLIAKGTKITAPCIAHLSKLTILNCCTCLRLKSLPPFPLLEHLHCCNCKFDDPFQSFLNVPNVTTYLMQDEEMEQAFSAAKERMAAV